MHDYSAINMRQQKLKQSNENSHNNKYSNHECKMIDDIVRPDLVAKKSFSFKLRQFDHSITRHHNETPAVTK